ncbi:MAG: DUF6427 family protein [Weeksellaceae bacterium]|jgi:hypothetical protein|nr:DUF6427 family protein [Weeksellaceae bacterium]
MLVKLLSRNSNILKIGISILFLALFFLRQPMENIGWERVIGVFFFLLSIVVSLLFFNRSNLINESGFFLGYLLVWQLIFSKISLDYNLSITLFSSTLIFLIVLVSEKRPENKRFLFNIGVLLSLSVFFYPPSLFLSGFLIFTYFYKLSINFRGFLLFLIGFSLPLILGVQILYIIGEMDWLLSYKDAFYRNLWHTGTLWALLPVGLLLVRVWYDHIKHLAKQDTNKRHNYFITFLYFLNWILILLFFGGEQIELLAFLGLSIAIFLSRFTQYMNSYNRKELFVWIYILIMSGFFFRKEIYTIYESLLGNVTL